MWLFPWLRAGDRIGGASKKLKRLWPAAGGAMWPIVAYSTADRLVSAITTLSTAHQGLWLWRCERGEGKAGEVAVLVAVVMAMVESMSKVRARGSQGAITDWTRREQGWGRSGGRGYSSGYK